MFTRILSSLLVLVSLAMLPSAAHAGRGERISLIRDAEVENTIRTYATPLFEAAGLDPQAVRVHLVKDQRLNAFVAGGMNLFLNTGLLIRAEHAGQVIGVIAHETGHISGGHLARMNDALAKASAESIIAMVLGAAAGVATGRGDVAGAMILGGQDMAAKNFLTYSRTQESSADQAATSFLDATRQSSRGLLEFMKILEGQELLVAERQDPYVRTHPLTRERITFLEHHVGASPFSDITSRPGLDILHRRMQAKLYAFLEPPIKTMQRWREDDSSLEARYARAIAHYRKPDMARAVPAIDALIAEHPRDPYFHELKGQMLFENGRPHEALDAYRRAVELLPSSALIRVNLAQVQVELEDPALLDEARQHLEYALGREPDNSFAWRYLAVAYGRDGDEGMASYALANHNLLAGRLPEAAYHAERAKRSLKAGTPAWLRVQDVEAEIQRAREEQRR